MDIDSKLKDYLSELSKNVRRIAQEIEPPEYTTVQRHGAWRFGDHSPGIACYLKSLKVISALNSCMVLLRAGYVQEIGALCRIIDDCCNEILFLLTPHDGNDYSKDQIQFLDDFFKEELDGHGDIFASEQRRSNLPVRKIHAAYGRLVAEHVNPSDAQETLRTVHNALSGYVHGAYPHIMEMFGSPIPDVEGMLGTPRIDEWRSQIAGYVYRATMILAMVAQRMEINNIQQALIELKKKIEKDLDVDVNVNAEVMLRKVKAKHN